KERLREDVQVEPGQLLDFVVPDAGISEAGLVSNIDVALTYLDFWLRGTGAAAIHNLMEDVATAEIARSQIWQWIHHGAALDDGRKITPELYNQLRQKQLTHLGGAQTGRLADAAKILDHLSLSEEFIDFLTVPAYELLV